MWASTKIKYLMKKFEFDFIEDFKYLHQYPELSFKEYGTTEFIKKRLKSLEIEILDYGLETGVVGYLKGRYDGPCIALRADIDGLPVQEESESAFPSLNKGCMHACGHDVHAGSLLAAARILAACKDELHGSVKFLFQPAEEVNLGAKEMVRHHVLENPTVSAIFGLHNSPEIPLGTVAVKNGALMAAVNRINITIKGAGGHGGVPHHNVDPVVCAASVIMAVQTIVSRNASPFDANVVSICNVQAGVNDTNNVTPDEVKMYGTVRTFSNRDTDLIEKRLQEIVEYTAKAYGCIGKLEFIRELSETRNTALYNTAYDSVKEIGAIPVDPLPSTGGEDFSVYQKECDLSFFYWLGVKKGEKEKNYPWHSPHFHADARCIAIGAGLYSMSVFKAIEYLERYDEENNTCEKAGAGF